MKVTYPVSDNSGNEDLVLIESFDNASFPEELDGRLKGIEILNITLERVSGETHTNASILSKISTFIAGILADNKNAVLYFYCDDIHDVKHRNPAISPQKFRNDLFSAMFKRYVQTHELQGIVDTTITARAERDIYIHLIAREYHLRQVNAIRTAIEQLAQK